MIELHDVGFAYSGGADALRGVSFSVGQGELVGLVGANGHGKSTLLALLAGLYSPTSGFLTVQGHASPGAEKAIRGSAALVLQEAELQVLGATVGEDLCLGLESDPLKRDEAKELAARLGLSAWDAPVQTLSFGQKRKLCLAGALLRSPSVLLLDEPFSGLDYPGAKEMRGLLAENKRAGLTQVVAAHDVEPLADLADRWLVLRSGGLAAQGMAADVFPRLESFDVRPPCGWRNEGANVSESRPGGDW